MKNSVKASLVIVCLVVAGSSGELNPSIKHRWASFGVGSWALQKTVPLEGGGREFFTRFTLKSLTPTAANVEIEIDINGEVTSKEVPWPIPEADSHPERTWEETVEFKGRSLRCQVLDYASKEIRIWNCNDVPGFTVKLKGRRTMTTLVDYEVKR